MSISWISSLSVKRRTYRSSMQFGDLIDGFHSYSDVMEGGLHWWHVEIQVIVSTCPLVDDDYKVIGNQLNRMALWGVWCPTGRLVSYGTNGPTGRLVSYGTNGPTGRLVSNRMNGPTGRLVSNRTNVVKNLSAMEENSNEAECLGKVRNLGFVKQAWLLYRVYLVFWILNEYLVCEKLVRHVDDEDYWMDACVALSAEEVTWSERCYDGNYYGVPHNVIGSF